MKYNISYIILFSAIIMSCGKSQTDLQSGIKLSYLDTTADYKTDFYRYATGGRSDSMGLPDEYGRYGVFEILSKEKLDDIRQIINQCAEGDFPADSPERKIGDLYTLYTDSVQRQRYGIKPVKPVLNQIDQIDGSDANISSMIARLTSEGKIYGLFNTYVSADSHNSDFNIFQISQSGMSLPTRNYYFDDDSASVAIRKAFFNYVESMFILFGTDKQTAHKNALTVMRLQTRLASKAFTKQVLRNTDSTYHKMSVDDIQKFVPQIDWHNYLAALNVSPDSINVRTPEALREAGLILKSESLDDIRVLFKFQAMDIASGYLTKEIFKCSFAFYSGALSGVNKMKPDWWYAVDFVENCLGFELGRKYTEKYFSPQSKQRVITMTKNIQQALKEKIYAQDWMSQSTKEKAVDKLMSMDILIGYPDRIRDYSAFKTDTSKSLYDNFIAFQKFDAQYYYSLTDKPVDKDLWSMTPQTVNAYYSPTKNCICFPAAILQKPFFNKDADDACNYGAIGVVIGHEMTHGFDDQGSRYDKFGNINEWWTPQERAAFNERIKVLEDYYSSIEVAPGLKADGALTLGENIADHGGLSISYAAFENIDKQNALPVKDGFTARQRFFLSYAIIWADSIRTEHLINLTRNDVHSVGKWRVNGQMPHLDAWYEAFNIDKNSPMYIPQNKRVKIW